MGHTLNTAGERSGEINRARYFLKHSTNFFKTLHSCKPTRSELIESRKYWMMSLFLMITLIFRQSYGKIDVFRFFNLKFFKWKIKTIFRPGLWNKTRQLMQDDKKQILSSVRVIIFPHISFAETFFIGCVLIKCLPS